MDFTQKKCAACEPEGDPLSYNSIQKNIKCLPKWKIDGKMIKRDFEFKDFIEALNFVNRVGDLAENEGHHPDISIRWNKVRFSLWTHTINGLSENDFILASKIDKMHIEKKEIY